MHNKIIDIILKSIDIKNDILSNTELIDNIKSTVNIIVKCFKNDGKVLFCGNGGSASDAQHLSAELSGRFYLDRKPLFAEALHVNTSYMTAVSNDYGFEQTYSRLVDAFGKKGDILIGLSTSGNSQNILNAFNKAKEKEMITISFTGNNGGRLKNISNFNLNIPTNITPRIQESHIMLGHIICEIIECELFKK